MLICIIDFWSCDLVNSGVDCVGYDRILFFVKIFISKKQSNMKVGLEFSYFCSLIIL